MFPPCFLPPPKKDPPRYYPQIVARLLPLMASVLAAQSGVTPFFRQDFQVPRNGGILKLVPGYFGRMVWNKYLTNPPQNCFREPSRWGAC